MVEVTAVIPTYNRRDWVQLAIDSVLAQREVSVECIVVDDGSSDGTGEVLQARYGERIRYVYQENAGESAARNHGARLASAPFFAFLDSDDLWLPGKLAAQLDFLRRNPDCGAVYCRAYAIDERGRSIPRLPYGANIPGGRMDLAQILRGGITASGSTIMVQTAAFAALGGYSTSIRHGEDVDFAVRLLLNGQQVGVIPRPLAAVRSHTHSQSLTMQREKFEASYRDHLQMQAGILTQSRDPAVTRAVEAARQNEILRMLVFYVYSGEKEQAAKLRRAPELPNPLPAAAFDRQVHYFTPLLYRDSGDPRRVLGFLQTVYAYRDAIAPVRGRGAQDALEALRAAVWCAAQDQRHAGFAWRQALAAVWRAPRLAFSPGLWKQIARLVFGRLFVQIALFWSHAHD